MLHLSRHFSSAPTSAQFAKEGEWERAWSFVSHELPDRATVFTYLAGSREVAFEAFFGLAFFGARYVGDPQGVEHFASRCLNALRAKAKPFLVEASELLGFPNPGDACSYSEIGCVNAWCSVGPLRLPDPLSALADFEATWFAVQRSRPYTNTTHPKAIEFVFTHPLLHWFGIPISEPRHSHPVNKQMLCDALRLLTPMAPTPRNTNAA